MRPNFPQVYWGLYRSSNFSCYIRRSMQLFPIAFRSSLRVFACTMPCAKCGQWIENQWLHWSFASPHYFLAYDVCRVSLTRDYGISFFYCARCTISKRKKERWTPGVYINEEGNESTDDEDEYFLNQQLPYCTRVL